MFRQKMADSSNKTQIPAENYQIAVKTLLFFWSSLEFGGKIRTRWSKPWTLGKLSTILLATAM